MIKPGEQIRAWCTCYVWAGARPSPNDGRDDIVLVNFGVGDAVGGTLEEACDKPEFYEQCRPRDMLEWRAVPDRIKEEERDPWMEYFPG